MPALWLTISVHECGVASTRDRHGRARANRRQPGGASAKPPQVQFATIERFIHRDDRMSVAEGSEMTIMHRLPVIMNQKPGGFIGHLPKRCSRGAMPSRPRVLEYAYTSILFNLMPRWSEPLLAASTGWPVASRANGRGPRGKAERQAVQLKYEARSPTFWPVPAVAAPEIAAVQITSRECNRARPLCLHFAPGHALCA
jgi:hypothetical protein